MTKRLSEEPAGDKQAEESTASEPASPSGVPRGLLQRKLQRRAIQRKPDEGQATTQPPPIERRHNLGVEDTFKLYDAELDRTNGALTLIVRIKFDFQPPDAGDKDSKLKFISDFKNGVEQRWSNQYLLVPELPEACKDPVQKYKAFVRVEPVEKGEHFAATVNQGPKAGASNTNTTHRTAELHTDDNKSNPIHTNFGKTEQSPAEHEFGHMLGLHHSNEKAALKSGQGSVYGDTKDQQFNVMGYGHLVTTENYIPFTTAMYYFSGCNWKAAKK